MAARLEGEVSMRVAPAELRPNRRRLNLLVCGFDLSYDRASEVSATVVGTVPLASGQGRAPGGAVVRAE